MTECSVNKDGWIGALLCRPFLHLHIRDAELWHNYLKRPPIQPKGSKWQLHKPSNPFWSSEQCTVDWRSVRSLQCKSRISKTMRRFHSLSVCLRRICNKHWYVWSRQCDCQFQCIPEHKFPNIFRIFPGFWSRRKNSAKVSILSIFSRQWGKKSDDTLCNSRRQHTFCRIWGTINSWVVMCDNSRECMTHNDSDFDKFHKFLHIFCIFDTHIKRIPQHIPDKRFCCNNYNFEDIFHI